MRAPSPRGSPGGAGGRPPAPFLVLALLLGLAPAAAASPLDLAGRPLRELAAHPEVAPGFRSVVRGRQGAVARHLAAGGVLSAAEGRHLHGWSCAGGDCGREGLFLGYDAGTERLYLLLIEGGRPSLTVPPRRAPWPAPLARAARAGRPGTVLREE